MFAQLFRAIFPPKIPANVVTIIETTADWWVNALRAPSYQTKSQDLGYVQTMVLREMRHQAPTEEALQKFKALMVEALTKHYTKSGCIAYGFGGIRMKVDYHPDEVLSVLGEKAGIPESAWPVKASTSIMAFAHRGELSAYMAEGRPKPIFAY